jgi:hypothetical protein
VAHLANKKYGIKDFIVSAVHEHYTSVDTVRLYHTGDAIVIGLRPSTNPNVLNIKVRFTRLVSGHSALSSFSKTASNTIVIESGSDYNASVKEQYQASSNDMAAMGIMDLPSWALGGSYIDNMDATITLMEANLITPDASGSTKGGIGQEGTTPGGIPWDSIVNAVSWVVGITALFVGSYMVYRIYRWKKHGEKLFPHLGGGQ